MDKQRITEFLEDFANVLDAKVRELDARMRELADERDAVRKTILSLRGAGVEADAGSNPAAAAAPPAEDSDADAMPQAARPPEAGDLGVDYTGATNLLERLRCVGRAAPGGQLRVGMVARLLIADGQSAASFNNLRRSVDQTFRTYPEEFEYVDRGTYRYHDAPP